jgi:hypothetical protein
LSVEKIIMQITSSLRPQPKAAVAKSESPKQDSNADQPAPPQDGFEPSRGANIRGKLVPAAIALGGAAAGLIGGFSDGIAGGIGGAISLGVAGASAATVVGAFEEFSGTSPDYSTRALVGGTLGVAFGGLVGALSSSGGVAAGLAVAGTVGSVLAYTFLKDS